VRLGVVVFLALVGANPSPDVPVFNWDGVSHYDFGYQMGRHFIREIEHRMQSPDLVHRYLPFYQTDRGKQVYQAFLNTHFDTFPDYIDELKGISDGSGVPFDLIFIQNIAEEFNYYVPAEGYPPQEHQTLHCSDYVVYSGNTFVNAHNEDYSNWSLNDTVMVTAVFRDANSNVDYAFIAYTYAGDLPSGAFGWNSEIAFSLNYLEPDPSIVLLGGLGRGFISRDLLMAQNMTDAISRITRPRQCAGHNYQLMDIKNKKFLNVEVGGGRASTKEVNLNDPPWFHANVYKHLDIKQVINNSSLHRQARVDSLPQPKNSTDLRNILGDQNDHQYPIFHDDLSWQNGDVTGDYTMATVLFDINAGTVEVLHGNPKQNRSRVFYVSSLRRIV